MEFKGLAIQTDAFEFNERLHVGSHDKCEVDFDLSLKIFNGQIVSVMDMQYYRANERLTPLASLRTTLKLWVGPNSKDEACSERVLFSLRTQHRYTCFILYQKLKPKNFEHFFLPTPSDEEFFRIVKSSVMADLIFNKQGMYKVGL